MRASLEAGSSDNVTCVVADVVASTDPAPDELTPLLVGAAAELPRRSTGGVHPTGGGLPGAGHGGQQPDPSGGRAATAVADRPSALDPQEPFDPEAVRYAPRPPQRFIWLRRLLVTLVVAGIAWVGLAVAWHWSQQQFYVGEQDGVVTIFRGINADMPGHRALPAPTRPPTSPWTTSRSTTPTRSATASRRRPGEGRADRRRPGRQQVPD